METKLGRDFYAQSAVEVAQGLLGREIVRKFPTGEVRGIISAVSAYEGETKSSSDDLRLAPGTLFMNKKFGHDLLNIATDRAGVASCVMLEGIILADQEVKGPGNVGKALHACVDVHGIKMYDNDALYVSGGKALALDPMKISGKSGNCKGHFSIR